MDSVASLSSARPFVELLYGILSGAEYTLGTLDECGSQRGSIGSSRARCLHVFEYQNGEYYKVFGRDACMVADTYFNTRVVVKFIRFTPGGSWDDADALEALCGGYAGNVVPYVTIRPRRVRTIIKDVLLSRRHSARVWSSSGSGPRDNWTLKHRASPGNLREIEEFLTRDGASLSTLIDSPVTMAVRVISSEHGTKLLGVALVNATARTMHVCQFVDDDQLSNLAAVAVQQGAKECVVCESGVQQLELAKIKELLDHANIAIVSKPSTFFSSTDIAQDLKRLLGSVQQQFSLLELTVAMQSLAALIRQLDLLREEGGFGRYSIVEYDLSRYMKLDAAAIDALNLFPKPSESNKKMNLFGLLGEGTNTGAGRRTLAQWIKQPLLDVAAIDRRLDYVEMLLNDAQLRQSLQQQHLRGIPDMMMLSKRFQRGKGSLRDLVVLYRMLLKLPALRAALIMNEGKHRAMLQREVIRPLELLMTDFEPLESMVEQCIDLDAVERHEYLINPAFDVRLTELAEEKAELMRGIEDLRIECADDIGLQESKVKMNHHTVHGYHLRVSRKDEKFIRNKLKFTMLETRKDGVRFTTKPLRSLARRYDDLAAEYHATQESIVTKSMEVVLSYAPVMDRTNSLLAELDVFVGMAHAAVNAPTPYCRPLVLPMHSNRTRVLSDGVHTSAEPHKAHDADAESLSPPLLSQARSITENATENANAMSASTDRIVLRGSRHPCMEVQESMSFIANDVDMVKGASQVQLITGPNMGGKSTYIRQVGVCVLMAQIGSFVPCDSATITMVDCILARVGAGDSQMQGVSTFMKEMLEASTIVKCTTPNSLLIIDELGRGTSTYDGFGLAWAICEYIAEHVSANTLFATHFHELTALAQLQPTVVNKHVTALATENSITMLYRIKDGPCDRSFGVHVAELANFPASVVAMARRKAQELEDFGDHAAVVDQSIHSDHDSDPVGRKRKNAGDSDSTSAKRQHCAASTATPEQRIQVSERLRKFCEIPVDRVHDIAYVKKVLCFPG